LGGGGGSFQILEVMFYQGERKIHHALINVKMASKISNSFFKICCAYNELEQLILQTYGLTSS
jgi:hypothetical protein